MTWGDYGDFMTPTLLNTQVAGILSLVVICTVAFFATRNLKLIPGGLQNAIEGITEAVADSGPRE